MRKIEIAEDLLEYRGQILQSKSDKKKHCIYKIKIAGGKLRNLSRM